MNGESGVVCRREVVVGAAAGLFAYSLSTTSAETEGRQPFLIGVTTSTDNSGLLAHLLDQFSQLHDIDVRVVTAGTGAVLNMASRGDVSAVLVHAPEDEEAFVAEGFGIDRRSVMANRFFIVGPEKDPAGIGAASGVADAFAAIATSESLFLSRGDESGTHKAEQRLWKVAGVDLGTDLKLNAWYRESGAGQGATLNIAVNIDAYCLTDEATWATFQNRGELVTLYDRDDAMMKNLYSFIRVNPARFSNINSTDALIFADWLTSAEGRTAIESFKVDGRPLFRADHKNQLAG